MLSILKNILLSLPLHLFLSIHLCLPLPSLSLSPSLAPCPVTSSLCCEGDRVISIMSSKGKCERAAGGKLGVAMGWCYWPSSPLHWPAVTLASSPLRTPDSSSLGWAVSGVTPHELSYTPKTYSSSRWGVTKKILPYLQECIPPRNVRRNLQSEDRKWNKGCSQVQRCCFNFIFCFKRGKGVRASPASELQWWALFRISALLLYCPPSSFLLLRSILWKQTQG